MISSSATATSTYLYESKYKHTPQEQTNDFKIDQRIILEFYLRGGIMFGPEYSVYKNEFQVSVLNCLLWVVDGFLNAKNTDGKHTQDLFIPKTARHMAVDQFFLFKSGVTATTQDLMLECMREWRRLYHIATEGKNEN